MSLIAPIFLAGLLFALLPVLLHRIQQQNAPLETFPSKHFLQQTRSSTSRRRRIRYKWLLALRLALLALLCFLFAQPLLDWASDALGEKREIHLLIIDDSFSMQHGDRWQQVLDQAESLVGEFNDSAGVIVISGSDASKGAGLTSSSISTGDSNASNAAGSAGGVSQALDPQSQLDQIRKLKPGLSALDLSTLLDQASRFADKQTVPVNLHLLGDMQRSALPEGINQLFKENLQSVQLHRIGDGQDYNVVLQANASWVDRDNLLIDTELRLSIAEEAALPERLKQLAVAPAASRSGNANSSGDLNNANSLSDAVQPASADLSEALEQQTWPVTLVLSVDGVVLQQQTLRLALQKSLLHQIVLSDMQTLGRDSGLGLDSASGGAAGFSLEISVSGAVANEDRLLADNSVSLDVAQYQPVQVGVLALDPIAQERDIAYLAAAFRQMNNIEFSLIDSRADQVPASVSLLVVLQTAGEIELPAQVQRYHADGGALLQVLAGSHLQDLKQDLQNAAAVAVSGESTDRAEAVSSIADGERKGLSLQPDPITFVDTSHPLSLTRRGWHQVVLTRPLWRSEDLNLLAAQLRSAQTASRSTEAGAANAFSRFSGSAEVLLASQSGVPLLLQAVADPAVDSGNKASTQSPDPGSRWLVLTAPLDGVSSNLPVSPEFVPFMQQITRYLLQRGRYPTQIASGQSLLFGANTQLLTPDDEAVFDIASTSRQRRHEFVQTGTYTVLEPRGNFMLQVGIDPGESDFQTLAPQTLESWQNQYSAASRESANALSKPDGQSSMDNNDEAKLQVWRWLLPALLLFVLIELLTANRVFRQQRTSL